MYVRRPSETRPVEQKVPKVHQGLYHPISILGVSYNEETPRAGWLVENPKRTWDDLGVPQATPMSTIKSSASAEFLCSVPSTSHEI